MSLKSKLNLKPPKMINKQIKKKYKNGTTLQTNSERTIVLINYQEVMRLLQSNTKTHKILRTVVKQTSEKPARAVTLKNKQT